MADCELLATCPFFRETMADMPAATEVVKQRYCRGDKSGCARYRVYEALGRRRVPVDLFPNETARARALIAQG